jgi:hypothetical protein
MKANWYYRIKRIEKQTMIDMASIKKPGFPGFFNRMVK